MTKVSVGWIVVVVVTVAAGLGVAQAQTFPDIHLDGGWKAWYFTLESRGQTGDGFMTGPVFSVDFDRKWTLGVAYLTTEIGKDVEATGRRAERSDFDMSLRYRLLDQLGVYVSFKRLEFSLDDRKEGELQHGSINGIGFGLAGRARELPDLVVGRPGRDPAGVRRGHGSHRRRHGAAGEWRTHRISTGWRGLASAATAACRVRRRRVSRSRPRPARHRLRRRAGDGRADQGQLSVHRRESRAARAGQATEICDGGVREGHPWAS